MTPRAQERGGGGARAAPLAPEVGVFCCARRKWGLQRIGRGARAALRALRAGSQRAQNVGALSTYPGSRGSRHACQGSPRAKEGRLPPRVVGTHVLKKGVFSVPRGQKVGGLAARVLGGGPTPCAQEPGGSRCGARTGSGGSRGTCQGAPHAQEGSAPDTHPGRGALPRVAGSPNAQEGKARAAPQAEEVGAHGACAGSAARARARSGGSRHVRRKDLPCAGGRTGTTRAGSESSCQGCPARAGNGELALRAQKREGAPCARWGKS